MPQKNSSKIGHDLNEKNNNFRAADLEQILNDLAEEIEATGFVQNIYLDPPLAPFLDKIIIWEDATMQTKRLEIVMDYGTSFPFLETVTKTFYKEDGSAPDSNVVTTLTYNANNTINTALTVATRL